MFWGETGPEIPIKMLSYFCLRLRNNSGSFKLKILYLYSKNKKMNDNELNLNMMLLCVFKIICWQSQLAALSPTLPWFCLLSILLFSIIYFLQLYSTNADTDQEWPSPKFRNETSHQMGRKMSYINSNLK